MAKVAWPVEGERKIIGSRISRKDGPAKVTGEAKYAYDINRPNMLWGKLIGSPNAHAELISVDTSLAKSVSGVQAIWIDEELIGGELRYVGQVIACVAAESEEAAIEAAEKVKFKLKTLPHQMMDEDASLSTGRPSNRETGNLDEGFSKSAIVIEGHYGIPVITHCCLEPHGQVTEIRDGELYVWPSTQNVSRYANQFGDAIDIPQNKIHVDTQYMGGGFGSKFNIDKWGVIGAKLSAQTGRPVKIMLDRKEELMIAGNRPSSFAKIKVGLREDGLIEAVDAEVWGSGGQGAFRAPPIPYVFTKVPHTRLVGKGIRTHRGGARAWRAPNHPQGCLLTMSAIDDAAAALGMDSLDFFMRNVALTDRPEVYREELQIAANLIDYRKKSHARGDVRPGPIKRGLGISIHTWGGRGHPSECEITIHSDASVEAKMGSQDLGTGTRTCIAMVIAETLGLPMEAITVHIGRNRYPASGPSGGSTTIGGISVSARRAATSALNDLLALVANRLGISANELRSSGGRIQKVENNRIDENANLSWKEACAMLGLNNITKRGVNVPGESYREGLISAGVGGVQIADVSVDIETGVVTMNEMVAVQDCGLIINMKLAESQVFGAMIMGITYALFEEAIYDSKTGKMLNADMEFYRLAGIKDVGRLKLHMMTGKGYDDRGVIGLGEPPVISPGAAISNAVANACGVRVPRLPLTPDRVLATLQKRGEIA